MDRIFKCKVMAGIVSSLISNNLGILRYSPADMTGAAAAAEMASNEAELQNERNCQKSNQLTHTQS